MTYSPNTIRSKSSLGFILISLCWAFPILAQQEGTKTNDLGENQVEAIVERLGNEDFATRKQAFQDLEKMLAGDDKAGEMLKKFAQHEDPEIGTRIRSLLQKQQDKILAQEKKKRLQLEFLEQIAKIKVLEKQADGVWRLDPADENKARSLAKKKSLHKIKLSITNQSKDPLKVYYMCACKHKDEGGGNRKHHAEIEPGKTHNCKETWEKRVYVITDMDDKALGLYLTGEKDAKIIHRGAPR
jgi:hypothetical protein